MKIITVTEKEKQYFLPMIPEDVLVGKVWILAAVNDEEIISVAVVGTKQPTLELRWIYTDEPQRRKGGARMIIEHLVKICRKHNYELKAFCEADDEYSGTLKRIFASHGFDEYMTRLPEYYANRWAIENSEFTSKYQTKNVPGEMFLSEISDENLTIIRKATGLSKYDLAKSNEDRSKVIINDGEVQALVLIDNGAIKDYYSIEYLYAGEGKSALAIQLVRNMIEEFLADEDFEGVIFECIAEGAESFAKKVLGREEPDSYTDFIHYEISFTEEETAE